MMQIEKMLSKIKVGALEIPKFFVFFLLFS